MPENPYSPKYISVLVNFVCSFCSHCFNSFAVFSFIVVSLSNISGFWNCFWLDSVHNGIYCTTAHVLCMCQLFDCLTCLDAGFARGGYRKHMGIVHRREALTALVDCFCLLGQAPTQDIAKCLHTAMGAFYFFMYIYKKLTLANRHVIFILWHRVQCGSISLQKKLWRRKEVSPNGQPHCIHALLLNWRGFHPATGESSHKSTWF